MPIVNSSDCELLFNLDPLFLLIHEKYGSPPNWARPAGFISLSKIILEQQVSLASANAHFLKLKAFLKEFSPAEIVKLTDEDMRRCQISRQKATYLRELSSEILNGNLNFDSFGKMTEPEIRTQLTRIKGIGNWTADIYLLFCLQAKDIFPAGDIAVINTIKELTPAQTKAEILILSETWKPFRSLATYFLWHYYLRKRNRG